MATLPGMLSHLLGCCDRGPSSQLQVLSIGADLVDYDCCSRAPAGEMQIVDISSDIMEGQVQPPVHLLTRPDDFDITRSRCEGHSPRVLWTPRAKWRKEQIGLPQMRRYPVPPHCSPDEPEERRMGELRHMYQVFVLDLLKGAYITQINNNGDYADVHCQLLDDLQTFKVDQGSGCIVEFPLVATTRLYRLIRNDGKCFATGSSTGPAPLMPLPLTNAEHIVVMEFVRRKLALLFNTMEDASCFLMCMELLVCAAQEQSGSRLGMQACTMPPAPRSPRPRSRWQIVTKATMEGPGQDAHDEVVAGALNLLAASGSQEQNAQEKV